MKAAGIAESLCNFIVQQGYDSDAVFGHAFLDTKAFENWLGRIQPKLDEYKSLSADDWVTHPMAAKLRILWKNVSGPPPAASAPALVAKAPQPLSKLTTTERERMRKEVESTYTGHVFSAETLPSMIFLQIIHNQCAGKNWEWVPWKRILSDAISQEVRANKNQVHTDLLAIVADSMGVAKEERAIEGLSSAYRIQCLLETRGNAYIMCKAAHLGSWTTYTKKFMVYYTRKHPDFMRGPTGAEAEEADQACLQAIFDLAFNGASLDEAIHQTIVERDMLRHLLLPRPKN